MSSAKPAAVSANVLAVSAFVCLQSSSVQFLLQSCHKIATSSHIEQLIEQILMIQIAIEQELEKVIYVSTIPGSFPGFPKLFPTFASGVAAG